MGQMNKIELAPKSGDLVILQDAQSGAWEVGRWAKESGSWVQTDGAPLRLFPTHWAPASGDPCATTWQGLSFPMPLRSQKKAAPKRHRTRFVLAFMAAVMIFVTGYAVYDFDFIGTGLLKNIIGSAADPELHKEIDRVDVLVRDLAAAREKIALLIAREKSVQAKALEANQTADARQKKLKKALDEKTVSAIELHREKDRVDVLIRDLAAAQEKIALLIARVKSVQAKALEAKQIADAKQKDLQKALDEKMASAEALAHELASARKNISSAGKHLNGGAFNQDGASTTEPLKHPVKGSNDSSVTTGAVPNTQNPDSRAPKVATPYPLSRPETRPSQSSPTGVPAVAPKHATKNNTKAEVAHASSQSKCNVKACAAAYESFDKSDCTYRPYKLGGRTRKLCEK